MFINGDKLNCCCASFLFSTLPFGRERRAKRVFSPEAQEVLRSKTELLHHEGANTQIKS